MIRNIQSGDYAFPVRIVAFNPSEGWSRDATTDIADLVAQRAVDTDAEITSALQAFIAANASRAFDVQPSLPPMGAALLQFQTRNANFCCVEIFILLSSTHPGSKVCIISYFDPGAGFIAPSF